MYKQNYQIGIIDPNINILREKEKLPLILSPQSLCKYPIQNTYIDYKKLNNMKDFNGSTIPTITQYFMFRDDTWKHRLTD